MLLSVFLVAQCQGLEEMSVSVAMYYLHNTNVPTYPSQPHHFKLIDFKKQRDAQRQYVVIGILAPIIVECLLFSCSDWGSGSEGGDVPLNQ